MNESQLLALVSALFGVLVIMLSWAGSRIFSKIDGLYEKIDESNGELHDRITHLDRRVTTIEARCHYEHDRRTG